MSDPTSSAEDFPASPSPWLVEDVPKPMSGGSGPRLPDAFATWDPDGHCWKTCQGSLFSQWETYSETWPRSGMTLNGKAYPQPPLVLLTSDGESSLWPTPMASKDRKSRRAMTASTDNGRRSGGGQSSPPGLEQAVELAEGIIPREMEGLDPDQLPPRLRAMLPTPSASSYGTNQGGGMGRVGPIRPSLQTMARRGLWPTPTVQDSANDGGPAQFERNSVPLNAAVKNWPTPSAANSRGSSGGNRAADLRNAVRPWPTPTARLGTPRGAQAKRYSDPRRSNDLDDAVAATGTTGQLSPAWVSVMMGFPPHWTEVD